jgi:hypothetical protein
MSTWTPNATVTIGGIDYTGQTLETVKVVRGRNDVYEEPRASYALCELIDLTGDGFPIEPLDRVTITIEDTQGIVYPLFTGIVSDWQTRLYDAGEVSGKPAALLSVIASGPLAVVNRRIIAQDGRAAEGDGDRIAFLIEQALAGIWDETGGTWNNLATPTTTWDTFDIGLDLALIDQPGEFTVAALPADTGGYVALPQSYAAAFSGRGVIYDTADGFVAYADGDRRRATAAADGYLQIPAGELVAGRIQTRSSQADIVNRVTVIYAGGSVIKTNDDSLFRFGLLATEFETILDDQTEADLWATDYLDDHARPVIKLRQIGIRLDGIDGTLRDELIDLDINSPVQLTGLPSTLALQSFPGFVEGIEWRVNRETVELLLNVSDASLSIGSVRWENVDATIAWQDVNALLTWVNAAEVTT